jgi:hypothetical protein
MLAPSMFDTFRQVNKMYSGRLPTFDSMFSGIPTYSQGVLGSILRGAFGGGNPYTQAANPFRESAPGVGMRYF